MRVFIYAIQGLFKLPHCPLSFVKCHPALPTIKVQLRCHPLTLIWLSHFVFPVASIIVLWPRYFSCPCIAFGTLEPSCVLSIIRYRSWSGICCRLDVFCQLDHKQKQYSFHRRRHFFTLHGFVNLPNLEGFIALYTTPFSSLTASRVSSYWPTFATWHNNLRHVTQLFLLFYRNVHSWTRWIKAHLCRPSPRISSFRCALFGSINLCFRENLYFSFWIQLHWPPIHIIPHK